jgi:hypothetical protein
VGMYHLVDPGSLDVGRIIEQHRLTLYISAFLRAVSATAGGVCQPRLHRSQDLLVVRDVYRFRDFLGHRAVSCGDYT